MSYRNERMARKFISLDRLAEDVDLGKSRIVANNGDGARRVRNAPDEARDEAARPESAPCQAAWEEKLAKARDRLVAAGLARLLPVLDQVVANGKNRRESIGKLAMKRHITRASAERFYDRGVRDLLAFFSPNEIKGETHSEKCVCL